MTGKNSLKRIACGLAAGVMTIAIAAPNAPATADGMVTAGAPAKVRRATGRVHAPAVESHLPAAPVAGGPLYGYYPYGHYYQPAPAYYYPPVPVYYYPPSRSCWDPAFARYFPC